MLVYLSKDKYEICMKKIKDDNESRERKRKLREEKRKYRPKIKLPSTSKLFLWIGFLLFVEIESWKNPTSHYNVDIAFFIFSSFYNISVCLY